MPGTLVSDALAPNLFVGGTDDMTSTGTTATVIEVGYPQALRLHLVIGTDYAGSSAVVNINIEGSDVVGFGSGVVQYGAFPTLGDAALGTYEMAIGHFNHRYIRASWVTSGTLSNDGGADVPPTSLKVHEDMYQLTKTDDAI